MVTQKMGARAKAGTRRPSVRQMLVLSLVLSAGIYTFLVFHYDFLSDDAFISFRYARNLATGQGLVFNPGERVEGYTNFLEVVTLAGLDRLGLDIVTAGRWFSLVGGLATLLLATLAAWRTLAFPAWLVWAVPLLIAVAPHFAIWGGSGLESTVFTALLMASVWSVLQVPLTPGRFVRTSVFALLLSLTRPEGVAYYALLVLLASWLGTDTPWQRLRRLLPGLSLFAVAGCIYMLWRWTYFGEWLPNTFHVKGGFSVHHVIRGGMDFLAFAMNPFVLSQLALAVVSGVVAIRERNRPMMGVCGLLAAVIAMSVMEGGDGLPMYRFFVPAVPLMALAAVDGVHRTNAWMTVRRLSSRGIVTTSTLLLIVLLVALSLFPRQGLPYQRFRLHRDSEVPLWSLVGRILADRTSPDTVVAAYPVGALGYYSNRTVIDMAGLTDPVIAKTSIDDLGTGWAGHEKHNGPYVLSRQPDMLLLGNIFVSRQAQLPVDFQLSKAWPAYWNREGDVVDDPRFARDYERSVMPLGDGWYLHYYARKP